MYQEGGKEGGCCLGAIQGQEKVLMVGKLGPRRGTRK